MSTWFKIPVEPYEQLLSSDCRKATTLVFLGLCRIANQFRSHEFETTRKSICVQSGCGIRTVTRGLQELKHLGIIQWEQRRNQTSLDLLPSRYSIPSLDVTRGQGKAQNAPTGSAQNAPTPRAIESCFVGPVYIDGNRRGKEIREEKKLGPKEALRRARAKEED